MCAFLLSRLEEAVAKQEKEWQSLLVELEHEISVTVGLLGTLWTRAITSDSEPQPHSASYP